MIILYFVYFFSSRREKTIQINVYGIHDKSFDQPQILIPLSPLTIYSRHVGSDASNTAWRVAEIAGIFFHRTVPHHVLDTVEYSSLLPFQFCVFVYRLSPIRLGDGPPKAKHNRVVWHVPERRRSIFVIREHFFNLLHLKQLLFILCSCLWFLHWRKKKYIYF